MNLPLRLYIPGSIAPVMAAIERAAAALNPPIILSFDRVAPSGKLAEEILAGARCPGGRVCPLARLRKEPAAWGVTRIEGLR